jgi:PilZ domain
MAPLPKIVSSQVVSDPVDKRSSPRYPFSTGVEAIDLQASMRITGRLSDISRHGCYMDTISPFAVNALLALTITKEGQPFKTQAKVVYSQNGMGMGLAFTTTEPDQAAVLEGWLDELSGGERRETEAPKLVVQAEAAQNADSDVRDILRELVVLLSRKNVMNDAEAMAMLRKLSK